MVLAYLLVKREPIHVIQIALVINAKVGLTNVFETQREIEMNAWTSVR